MSRSGYSEDLDEHWQYALWRGRVLSSIRGKRGQGFLRELVEALEAMPEKRLITGELRKDGEVCALGALGAKRGLDMSAIDPEDYETVAEKFGIAQCLSQEVVYLNDEQYDRLTPEERWVKMHAWAKERLKTA